MSTINPNLNPNPSSGLFISQTPEGPETIKKTTRRRRRKAREGSEAEMMKKRKLTDEQVKFLEMNFGEERKLESGRKMQLATELGLDPKQVAVWFQNRRARWKNKQIEEEYAKLKSRHDAIVVDKCHVENEVLSLKKRLTEAEETIKRLSRGGGGDGGSPSSSSTGTYRTHNMGEFDEFMYMNEDNYYYIMENGYMF